MNPPAVKIGDWITVRLPRPDGRPRFERGVVTAIAPVIAYVYCMPNGPGSHVRTSQVHRCTKSMIREVI